MFRALDWLLDSIAPVHPRHEASELDDSWIPAKADGFAVCESPLEMMLSKARRAAETAVRE